MQEIQIFTDRKGNKTSVIVAYEDWLKLNEKLETLQNKLEIATNVQNGIKEVKAARKTGRKLQNLSDFINENRS